MSKPTLEVLNTFYAAITRCMTCAAEADLASVNALVVAPGAARSEYTQYRHYQAVAADWRRRAEVLRAFIDRMIAYAEQREPYGK